MKKLSLAALISTLAFAGGAHAAVLSESNLSMADAQKLATATVAACQAKGYNVSAAVVDRAGLLKAFARADNAGPHTIEASRAKAFTAVSAKTPTLTMMENAQKNPGVANLTDIPGFLLLGGGVPIKAGNSVIGAIGVAGAPGGNLDAQCADAVLEENAALFK
ncbi:MAG: GlcG/HbpS family heme-binding protein [Achromobacter mucicolens]|uniref:GlcG/HbpS family heme-binding protein n=1 Tax=Achromobacter mucicolens TaxID=1389922 RepID=UPI003D12D722